MNRCKAEPRGMPRVANAVVFDASEGSSSEPVVRQRGNSGVNQTMVEAAMSGTSDGQPPSVMWSQQGGVLLRAGSADDCANANDAAGTSGDMGLLNPPQPLANASLRKRKPKERRELTATYPASAATDPSTYEASLLPFYERVRCCSCCCHYREG